MKVKYIDAAYINFEEVQIGEVLKSMKFSI